MPSRTVILTNATGLHARPAKVFADAATRTGLDVIVRKGDAKVNGRSVLSVLTLDGHRGDEITITIEGPGAQAALDDLVALVEAGLGDAVSDGASA